MVFSSLARRATTPKTPEALQPVARGAKRPRVQGPIRDLPRQGLKPALETGSLPSRLPFQRKTAGTRRLTLETAVGSTDYGDSTDWKPVERGCRFTPRVIWKQRRGEASSPAPSVKSVKSVDNPTAAFRLNRETEHSAPVPPTATPASPATRFREPHPPTASNRLPHQRWTAQSTSPDPAPVARATSCQTA